MDHSCHVFRSGSPGGTLRPPLPFFPVWAHPVASYAGCSVSVCHGCIKGDTGKAHRTPTQYPQTTRRRSRIPMPTQYPQTSRRRSRAPNEWPNAHTYHPQTTRRRRRIPMPTQHPQTSRRRSRVPMSRAHLDASTTDLLRIPAPPCWCCFWRHGKCAMGVSHWDITPCRDAHPPGGLQQYKQVSDPQNTL